MSSQTDPVVDDSILQNNCSLSSRDKAWKRLVRAKLVKQSQKHLKNLEEKITERTKLFFEIFFPRSWGLPKYEDDFQDYLFRNLEQAGLYLSAGIPDEPVNTEMFLALTGSLVGSRTN